MADEPEQRDDEATAAEDEGAAPEAKAPAKAKRAAKPAAKRAKAADGEADDKPAPKAKAAKPRARKASAEDAPATEAKAEKAADEPAGKAPAQKPAARRGAGRDAGRPQRRRVVRAKARYVRTSARKARMVCGHLRGKTVAEARAILEFTPREVAGDWRKLLESAVANAEANHELLEEDLIVREAFADEGPTIKRFRPRAMGRATPIRKRTSHLTIALVARTQGESRKQRG